MLVDREREKRSIERLVQTVRAGSSAAIVLCGEPGIGKTALLDYAAEAVPDLQVIRVTGVEPEMDLGFAALHQLARPLLSFLVRLPVPQQEALRAAFGQLDGPTPDRFLVGLAMLSLLTAAAEVRPLLCLVDDAQWLDSESGELLAFVARRLHAERVGMLFAVRESPERDPHLGGLPSLCLGGLPDRAAEELLQAIARGPVDTGVARRVIAETRGNPLAILELTDELSAAQLAGVAMLPEPLPVGAMLEERFLQQIGGLQGPSRMLLLLCAADSSLDADVLRSAAAQLNLDVGVAALAAEHHLVLGRQVHFRHPLVRSAVYAAASGGERRRAHEALAAAYITEPQRDRRAWHRAAATVGPDEDIAAELDHSADRARARGGYAASAARLARAAELTVDRSLRADRLLRAATAALAAGATDVAHARLDEAIPHLTGVRPLAEARRLRGVIRFARGGTDAPAILLQAARELAPIDLPTARETLLDALEAAHWFGGEAEGASVRDVARLVQATPAAGPQSTADLLLDGFAARLTGSFASAVTPLRAAVAALREDELETREAMRWLGLGCCAAGELCDAESLGVLAGRWVTAARAAGALSVLPLALGVLAGAEVLAGHFDVAEGYLDERREVASATNTGVLGTIAPQQLLLMAWRGRASEARSGAAAVLEESIEHSSGNVVGYARHACAVLELGLGNYEAALGAAIDAYEDDPLCLGTHVLPDIVEAGARCRSHAVALSALERLSDRAVASGTDLALGLLARSRAVLAQGGAEPLYRESIEHLARTSVTPELARAHLLLGEWLRRERRRRDARRELRAAEELFSVIGAAAFAERSRNELLATGEHTRRRSIETRDELTAQEARIAEEAAHGASNAEIAAQLFISQSTVAYHLRKVFRKLGVDSRAQLARALAREGVPAGTASPVASRALIAQGESTHSLVA